MTYPVQDTPVSRYLDNAPALNGTGEATPAQRSGTGLAVPIAEFAVLLVRGSAAAILLSPAVFVAILLTG